ncbi:MAG: ArsR/SmtB family transcription factor [Planctomycetota bacterium]|jgi:ArsR family transcriptional regulator
MPADAHDRMFRAFADRTRLRLLNLLRDGEICVGDLVSVIGAPQPTVSRHLAALREAGLVQVERDGTWCFYSLAAPTSELHGRMLECLECCLGEVPRLRRDLAKLTRLREKGSCCTRAIVGASAAMAAQSGGRCRG